MEKKRKEGPRRVSGLLEMKKKKNKGPRRVSDPWDGEDKKKKRKIRKTRPETRLGPCGDGKKKKKERNQGPRYVSGPGGGDAGVEGGRRRSRDTSKCVSSPCCLFNSRCCPFFILSNKL